MYSGLLFVAALLCSHAVLAEDVVQSPAVESAPEATEELTINSERQDRKFWLPLEDEYLGPYNYFPYWPVDPAYYPQLRSRYPSSAENEDVEEIVARQNPWGLSNINSAVNPIAALSTLRPNAFIPNPNAPTFLRRFDSCTDVNGLPGICAPSAACAKFGGRPSGFCGFGLPCCVSTLQKCGGQITLNNTFWQSPPAISSDSTCGLTVTLDTNLVEQKRDVCQVRLDFVNFVIDQPDAQSLCSGDSFVVGGATNRVPVICGDNTGQHMYLNAPSSTFDLVLLFRFGPNNVARSWNIQISMIPCGATSLAPPDCLQYFTGTTGTFRSFNWRDVAPAGGPRHLGNQDYQICFRNELIGTQVANRLCFQPCDIANNGRPFFLSGALTTSLSEAANCLTDYLIIRDGFDPAIPANIADRYCGGALNPLNAGPAVANVCTSVGDFAVTFRTDAAETVGDNNSGFCLKFVEVAV